MLEFLLLKAVVIQLDEHPGVDSLGGRGVEGIGLAYFLRVLGGEENSDGLLAGLE